MPPAEQPERGMPLWGRVPAAMGSLLHDLPIVLACLALFYALLALTHYWLAPPSLQTRIHLEPSALPGYAAFSLLRIAIAYALSLLFTFVYGYVAAYNARAEQVLIPLLDTLQSIPVLSFLPAVMLAMVSLFPRRQFGLELGSILLIFTGQVWNMTFSFYSSLKGIPQEMRDVASVYRWSWWQRFTQMELPFSAIGLVWNSMMSVAGGWFFLMACEMFVLGNRDLRLPGLGSYLQTAANAGDTRAILFGVAAMIGVIVLVDLLVWRPVIAWAEKFKFEQVEAAETRRSPVLNFLRRSSLLELMEAVSVRPALEALTLHFARSRGLGLRLANARRRAKWPARAVLVAVTAGLGLAIVKMGILFGGLRASEVRTIFTGAGATLLRVELTLLLGTLWTVPVGVAIGLHPRLSALAQPVAQVAASVPATALFPIILLLLIRAGHGLGIGSVLLLLLGTQWYILFNVIAGATALPTDLKEVCEVFHYGLADRWRKLILPGIFPYLVTGFVTASGGAWNASIVAEYFHFRGETFSTVGLGAVISGATDAGNSRVLLAATLLMSVIVVAINRFVWRRMYALAATKYKLEA
jgi:NitT/TauT family transport system permease protein